MNITNIVVDGGLRIAWDTGRVDQLIWEVINGRMALTLDGQPISDAYLSTVLNGVSEDPRSKLLWGYMTSSVGRNNLGFNEQAYTWNDLRVPLTSTQAIGVNAPTFAFFRNDGGPAVGQAARFGSAQSGSTIPYNAKQDLASSFSVSLWVKMILGGGFGSLSRFIAERPDHFSIVSDDDLYVRFNVPGVGFIQTSDDLLTADTFDHIVCVCSVDGGNTELSIYIDDQLAANGTFSGTPDTSDEDITIGDRASTGRYLDGDIDELAIYNDALAISDVDALWSGGAGKVLTGSEANLVGLYHFDEDAVDSSSGTAVNMNYLNPSYQTDAAVGGTGSTGVRMYAFQTDRIEEVFFSLQLDHGIISGSDLYPHVHWSSTEDLSGEKVRWGLEYTFAQVGGIFTNTAILEGDEAISDAKAYEHNLTPLGIIQTHDLSNADAVSGMLHGRVYRDGISDSYSGSAYLQEIDFHVKLEGLGSPEQFSK